MCISVCVVHLFSHNVIVFATWNIWIVCLLSFVNEKFLWFQYLPNWRIPLVFLIFGRFFFLGGWGGVGCCWMLDTKLLALIWRVEDEFASQLYFWLWSLVIGCHLHTCLSYVNLKTAPIGFGIEMHASKYLSMNCKASHLTLASSI